MSDKREESEVADADKRLVEIPESGGFRKMVQRNRAGSGRA